MAYKDKAAKTAYQNNFIAKAYDRITLLVPKGDKEKIKEHAANRGESVNSYIKQLIGKDMQESL